MIDKLEYKGLWFLPHDKERKVPGTLTFDPTNNRHVLELIGSFYDMSEHDGEEIILGVTSRGDEITLHQCQFSSSTGIPRNENDLKVGFRDKNKPCTLNFRVNYMLEGIHIPNIESLTFNSIYTTIYNLHEWVGISGIGVDREIPNCEDVITFTKPQPIVVAIDEDLELEIKFHSNFPSYARAIKEQTLKQYTTLALRFKKNQSIEGLLYNVKKFQNFLSASTQSQTRIEAAEIYSDQFRNKYDMRIRIKLFTIISPNLKFEKPKEDWQMIFTYNNIESNFKSIIQNWFKNYEKFEAPLNLVFGQFYLSEYYLEVMFINVAQAAESFHSKLKIEEDEERKIQDVEFKRKRDLVLNSVPEELRNWVNSKLTNPHHFDTRLKYLISEFSNAEINKMIGDEDKFIKAIVITRNYLTHYHSKGKKEASDGLELVLLMKRLRLLLICSFLVNSGMDKNLLEKLIKEKSYMMFRSYFD
jgi:hypothetical protein